MWGKWKHHNGERPDPHNDGHYDPGHPISRSQPCPDNNERDNDDGEGSEARSLGHGFRARITNAALHKGRQQPEKRRCEQETRGQEDVRTNSQSPLPYCRNVRGHVDKHITLIVAKEQLDCADF